MEHTTHLDKSAESKAILSILQKDYGPADWRTGYDPISELVFTILTKNTSDRNAEKAFNNLTAQFTMHQLLEIDVSLIQPLIAAAGLSNIKAPRIKNALKTIVERRGELDLWFLQSISPQEAKDWLRSIDGIGPKTAAVVLCLSLGIPALPVDTHVHRVTKRLGLIAPTISADKAHDQLEALVDPKDMLEFHMQIIRHGRTICSSRSPKCQECPIIRHCMYGTTALTQS